MNTHFASIVNGADIERLLHHMPTVAIYAENTWAKGFAQSIVRQARRKGWSPSPKQFSVMKRLVQDLFAYGGDTEGDIDVIE